MRVHLLLITLAVVGCSTPTNPGAVEVTVVLEPGLLSQCVRVSASDGAGSIESEPIVIGTKTSLKVGIVPVAGLTSPLSIRAFGFFKRDCTEPIAGEVSEPVTARFSRDVERVTVTLRPAGAGDGGVDMDGDGYFPPADCNDFDPNLNPGKTESCTNGLDDDCDRLTDCSDDACFGMACPGNGTCVADAGCLQAMEMTCDDRVDNDLDGLFDCADVATCLGQPCSDGNACTTGDLCQPDGTCGKTGDVMCNMPPSPTVCFAAMGTCQADAGSCTYAPTTNACDDGDACTMSSTCSNGQCVGGPRTPCTSPPACRMNTTCNAATGNCDYPPAPSTMGCNDGDNCTTGDRCDGMGTCVGTTVPCNPNQCQSRNGCSATGVCQFTVNTGMACDAGMSTPGQCTASANCVMPPLFNFPVSNFAEADLPATGAALTINCQVTLDTSAQTVSTNGCGVTMPPSVTFTPTASGGQSTLLIRLSSMILNSGADLVLVGNRPALFAVTGPVIINANARIRATNGGAPPSGCTNANGSGGDNTGNGTGNGTAGGGGGGFGTNGASGGNSGGGGAGAAGQTNGGVTLIPLRGGCPGGAGTSAGGAGGGAIQITASGMLTVNGVINAGGVGGRGATTNGGNSGGGGGSGGAILLESPALTLNMGAALVANGGGGGEGSKGQVGAPGSDGLETTTRAPGGTGNNGDDGGDGAASGGVALSGGAAGNNDGGGGGGGGVGRIRLNAFGSCTRNATTVSPMASTMGCP